MDPYVLKSLNAAKRAREAAVVVTDLEDGRDGGFKGRLSWGV